MAVTEDEVAEEYERLLAELTCNSKPQINILTMLAEENESFSSKIVQIIETRIYQVPNDKKLPILYLIDSIVKNCPKTSYKVKFSKNLVEMFVHVFEKGDKGTRQSLHRLRGTWNDHFPKSKLYGIDIKVSSIDRGWPIDKAWPVSNTEVGSRGKDSVIHVNPKFINPAVAVSNAKVDPTFAYKTLEQHVSTPAQPSQYIQKPFSAASSICPEVFEKISKIYNRFKDDLSSKSAPTSSNNSENKIQDPLRKPVSLDSSVQQKQRPAVEPGKSVGRKQEPQIFVTISNPDKSQKSSIASVVTKVNSAEAAPVKPFVKVVKGSESWKMEVSPETSRSSLKIFAKSQAIQNSNLRKIDVGLAPAKTHVNKEDAYSKDYDADVAAISKRSKNVSRGGAAGASRGRGKPTNEIKELNLAPKAVSADKYPTSTKRQRSPSPEITPNKTPKRGKSVLSTKINRSDVDVETKKAPSKLSDSGNGVAAVVDELAREIPQKQDARVVLSPPKVQPKAVSSYVLSSLDTDMRNANSTDSDRSSKDVDLRTLPLKKRKHSDNGSASADTGYPSDQGDRSPKPVDIPKQSATTISKIKKRPTTSAVKTEDLDDLLFGSGKGRDGRLNQQPAPSTSTLPKFQRKTATADFADRARPSISPVLRRDLKHKSATANAVNSKNTAEYSREKFVDDIVSLLGRCKRKGSGPKFNRKPADVEQSYRPKPAYYDNQQRGGGATGRSGYSRPLGARRDPRTSSYPRKPHGDEPAPYVIPADNKIIVDRQSYDVFYVNDVAVIERSGLPHRLFYAEEVGDRSVIIDNFAVRLKFDETRDVPIDGKMHTIRFGGPSRELYIGNFPFRCSFGGPPIFPTINGVKHLILLGGPEPKIKIEPEPSPDLPIRPIGTGGFPADNAAERGGFISTNVGGGYNVGNQQIRQQPSHHRALLPTPNVPLMQPRMPRPPFITPPPMPMPFPSPLLPQPPQQILPQPPRLSAIPALAAPAPPVNVDDLLNKLLNKGLISSPPSGSNTAAVVPPAPTRVEITSKSNKLRVREPPVSLVSFDRKALKTRYTSVVNALSQERTQCSVCGMRFLEKDQQKYSKHLDWHFKQKRLAKMPGRSSSRSWYFASEDWVKYEEFGDENSVKAKSNVFEPVQTQTDELNKFITASTDSVIPANFREDQNQCSVCGEKFEEFWEEEEEIWKIRNAMMVGDKACHPLCYQDASHLTSPSFGSPGINENPTFWPVAEPTVGAPSAVDSAGNSKANVKANSSTESSGITKNVNNDNLTAHLMNNTSSVDVLFLPGGSNFNIGSSDISSLDSNLSFSTVSSPEIPEDGIFSSGSSGGTTPVHDETTF